MLYGRIVVPLAAGIFHFKSLSLVSSYTCSAIVSIVRLGGRYLLDMMTAEIPAYIAQHTFYTNVRSLLRG